MRLGCCFSAITSFRLSSTSLFCRHCFHSHGSAFSSWCLDQMFQWQFLVMIATSYFPHNSHHLWLNRYTVMPKQSRLLVPVAHKVLDMYASVFGLSSSIRHLVSDLILKQPNVYIKDCLWVVILRV